MKKKILSFLILLCMTIALLPTNITVFAATSGTCGNYLTWTFDNGTLKISGTGKMTDYSYRTAPWYSNITKIKTVDIQNGVTTIGDYAFNGCTSLTNVTISNQIKSIGDCAFSSCSSLKSVTIGKSVTRIDESAFLGCRALEKINWNAESVANFSSSSSVFCNAGKSGNGIEVIFGDNVKKIPAYAFYQFASSDSPKILNVTIGKSVTSIGNSAFYGCAELEKINWNAESVANFSSSDNVFCNAGKSGNGIEVVFGDNVKKIPTYAFYNGSYSPNCYPPKISNVTIGKNVTSIGNSAFFGCDSLKSAKIGKSVTNIDRFAFGECTGLTEITFPDNLESIGDYAFRYCENLTSITIPGNVTIIGLLAFGECSKLSSITVSENNKYFSSDSNGILYNKDKTELIQYPVRSSKKEFVIPSGVTSIGRYAFYYCNNLTSVTIPDSVKSICQDAFEHCESLSSITIPNNVTSIDSSAFAYCTGLKQINWNAENVEDFTSTSNVFYVAGENNEGIEVVFGDNVKKIPAYAFATHSFNYSPKILNVTIGKSVTSIGKYAFGTCDRLTDITVPNSVTSIGDRAFSGCSSLKNINYNGSNEDWNKISIGTNNEPLNNSKINYFWYVTICDNDGKEISRKTQNDGEKLDTSEITVPNGYALKLYKDKELTQEYSLDTPISENLTLYYDLIEINKLKITGAESADIGQKDVEYNVSFATDKSAKNFIATIKYSDKLNLSAITDKDFSVTEDIYETADGYIHRYLTCTYNGDGNMPTNTPLNPFELIFDISENAKANDILTVEFVGDETFLADNNSIPYDFDSFETAEIKINPIPVKSITINGADEIDTPTQYTAVISPENATTKEVEWTVDNSEIATIAPDGTLTPQKAGTVKITATAKDGSGIVGEKTVNVKVYAQITSLSANVGVWNKDFAPSEREYVIYVPKNTTLIKLKAQHSGTLKAGTSTFYNNKDGKVSLTADETVLTLNYSETGCTDSTYIVKIVKFEGTKTTVSEDGKTFNVKPINIASGNTVILALYNGKEITDIKYENYTGADILFTSDKAYTNAKVMVWNNLDNMTPVCDTESVK